jgi:hypothetical protein
MVMPANPPEPAVIDFDPAAYDPNANGDGMDLDEDDDVSPTHELSSVEINILVYLVCLLPFLAQPGSGTER